MDFMNCFDDCCVYDVSALVKLNYRSSTDGYQPKFFTSDRQKFIKAQASLSGVLMHDWKVEILASNICNHWHIPCIQQKHCKVITKSGELDAVESRNFGLDKKEFQSFRSLLDHNYLDMDDEFIHLDAVAKLRWCADKLSTLCNLEYSSCEKYMIDLAMIDCIIGNTDRHSKNYGVFFNIETSTYEIALVFDNGMGLFENDYYRDSYKSYNDAMHNVYVSPYGEDPFELVELLSDNFDLSSYDVISLPLDQNCVPNDFAKRYLSEMMEKIRRLQ